MAGKWGKSTQKERKKKKKAKRRKREGGKEEGEKRTRNDLNKKGTYSSYVHR